MQGGGPPLGTGSGDSIHTQCVQQLLMTCHLSHWRSSICRSFVQSSWYCGSLQQRRLSAANVSECGRTNTQALKHLCNKIHTFTSICGKDRDVIWMSSLNHQGIGRWSNKINKQNALWTNRAAPHALQCATPTIRCFASALQQAAGAAPEPLFVTACVHVERICESNLRFSMWNIYVWICIKRDVGTRNLLFLYIRTVVKNYISAYLSTY